MNEQWQGDQDELHEGVAMVTTAPGRLAEAVRCWAAVNDGELNRAQVRELLRYLGDLDGAARQVQGWTR